MRTRLSPRLSIVACVATLAAAGCSQSPNTMSAISPSSLGATTDAKAGGPPNLNAELAAVRGSDLAVPRCRRSGGRWILAARGGMRGVSGRRHGRPQCQPLADARPVR